MARREDHGATDMAQLDAMVKAATDSPAFRAKLFAFAADNVTIQRNEAGMQQPSPVRTGGTGVDDAHRLLIEHQITDPQANPRQAYEMLRQMATDPVNTAFSREVMAFGAPAGSPNARVPKLLMTYVETHDQEGKTIMKTMHNLESRHGSGPDEAAAFAATKQPLEELLRARCLAIARQLRSYA